MRIAHGTSQPYPQNAGVLPQTNPPPPPRPPPTRKSSGNVETFKFEHPLTMIVAGPTMSGKSTWIKNLLLQNAQLIYPSPHRILWIFKRWQPLYDELKHWIPNIQFIEGITEDIKSDALIDSRDRMLLIIDDMIKDATQEKEICELYTESTHHRNLSVIYIMQNLFNRGKKTVP